MGIIKEIPGLQIDDFKTYQQPPLLCLLTHAHSDHLLGLDRQSYYGPLVYCTATTRSLVLNLKSNNNARNHLKYNHLRKEHCGIEILQVLDLNTPKHLKCGSQDILVTAIDAHHCPGSCMFLVQSQSQAILYTGDIRCEQWYVNMLAIHPSLLPFTLGKKQINVYMDNIYEQHHQHSLEYHSSSTGITQLAELLERGYPTETPFCAVFTTIGYENILIALAERFDTQIHMDPYYYNLYVSAADTCPVSRALVAKSTTNNASGCRIHWCKKGDCSVRDQKNAVYFSPCITISEAAVNERNKPLELSNFDVTGHCELPVYGDATTGARYILGIDKQTLLPGHLLFYFSRHASRPCLAQLIDTFTTKTVRSLDGNPMQGFSSFQSSSGSKEEDLSTDASQPQQPLTTLPMIRKQPVRMKEKPERAKRVKYSSSSSHDEALMFLQGAGRAIGQIAGQMAAPDVKTEESTLEGEAPMEDEREKQEKSQEQQTKLGTSMVPEPVGPVATAAPAAAPVVAPTPPTPPHIPIRIAVTAPDTVEKTPSPEPTPETQESLVIPLWRDPQPLQRQVEPEQPSSSNLPATSINSPTPGSPIQPPTSQPPPTQPLTSQPSSPTSFLDSWFSMKFDFQSQQQQEHPPP